MLKHIKLTLARNPGHPQGDARHGYDLVAPLDAEGHLDLEAWKANKEACTVRRFQPGTDDEHGVLLHGRGGRWMFSYEEGDDDDEPLFKMDRHVFKTGEYVTVTEHDGQALTFQVTVLN